MNPSRQSIWLAACAIGAAVVLLAGIGPALSEASAPPQGQSEIHRPAQTPPPGFAERENQEQESQRVPPPGAAVSKQQLEAIIMKQNRGAQMLQMAKSGQVPGDAHRAAAGPPPQVAERSEREEEEKSIPQPSPKASKQALEALIMRQQGGAQNLQKAKQGKPPEGASNAWPDLREWFSDWNPFTVQEAHAFAGPPPPPVQSTSSSFPDRNYRQLKPATMNGNNANFWDLYSPSPTGRLDFYSDGATDYATPARSNTYISNSDRFVQLTDGTRFNNYAQLYQTFPTNGYYIVNFKTYCYTGTTVTLAIWSGAWQRLQDYPCVTGWNDMPRLAYFAAGSYYFTWGSNRYMYAHGASVQAYP